MLFLLISLRCIPVVDVVAMVVVVVGFIWVEVTLLIGSSDVVFISWLVLFVISVFGSSYKMM